MKMPGYNCQAKFFFYLYSTFKTTEADPKCSLGKCISIPGFQKTQLQNTWKPVKDVLLF